MPLPPDQMRYSYIETRRANGKVNVQVAAVPSETTAPQTITQVAATNASDAIVDPDPFAFHATKDTRSKAAHNTYETIGKSVSGGWSGLPAQPRSPRNFRPRRVMAGLIEYSLGTIATSVRNRRRRG